MVILLLFAGLIHARSPLRLTATASLSYDDNVFCYSPRDESSFLYRFQEGSNPERFAGVRSLDDLVADVGLRLSWRVSLIRRHTTLFSLRMTGHQYLSNSAKSYFSGTVRLRQYWARGTYVEGSYLLTPRYLIRNYRDFSATPEFSPCAFTEHLGGMRVNLPILDWLAFSSSVRYEFDKYVQPFAVYDTRAWRTGADLIVSPVGWIAATVSYEYKSAQAAGPKPDISYRQHEFGAALEPRWQRLRFRIGYFHPARGYTATQAQDSTHAGRIDITRSLTGRLALRLTSQLTITGEAGYERRSCSSPYRSDIEEVKDYDKRVVRMGIRYGGAE